MKMRTKLFSIAFGIYLSPLAFAQSNLPDSCALDVDGQYVEQYKVPCGALDNFLTTFNSKDELVWAKTLNYPHVRMSGNQVTVWETPEAYAADQDLQQLADALGWENTQWDYRYIVQEGLDGADNEMKYHVALSFTRLDKDGNPIPGQTHDSFYIITNKDGHWGTQFRSSMAGSLHGKSAY